MAEELEVIDPFEGFGGSEESRRLGIFARFALFESIEEIFKKFKEQFDSEAKLYREHLPLNEDNSKISYIACYTTSQLIDGEMTHWYNTKFFWVYGENKSTWVVVSSPINNGADQHGGKKV